MTKICVTGASGRAGRHAVAELLAHDYEVSATDVVAPSQDIGVRVLLADLTDYGQAVEVLTGADAVVHLANIPAPGRFPAARTFAENATMNYNVFSAATALGLNRVVWASSETTLGLPFDTPPRYAPVDEAHYPYPTSSYALSKVVSETMAEQFTSWSGIPFVGLRFSNIVGPVEYATFPQVWRDPALRKWNLWGYIDERDSALACRLGLEAEVSGAQSFIIAATDTALDRPSLEVLKEYYPEVPVTREIGEYQTLLSIDKATEVLGFRPRYSWRDTASTQQ